MELKHFRSQIDSIDKELVALFCKRMQLAKSIAEYKSQNGLAVLDASRERELLEKISQLSGDELESYTRILYESILSLSRAYQESFISNGSSELAEKISNSVLTTPKLMPKRADVACQGIEGAYSQAAAQKLFDFPNIKYYRDFADVFSAVESGECRYGILPLENSTAGSVNKVHELMLSHRFYIVRSVRVRISHNLYANPGTKLEDIREIISHEQALHQSEEFIRSLTNVKSTSAPNTAIAAKAVKESGRFDLAALASNACGSLYGLNCIASSVQDKGANYTRFICISKELELYPGSDKTTLMLIANNRPGALYRILSRLNAAGINMTRLESCSIPDKDFEARFYVDAELSIYDPAFTSVLSSIESECEEMRYLGTYSEQI